MGEIEFPIGYGHVGSLLSALVCLEIPGCGHATIREHEGLRYILAPQGCGCRHGCQKGVLWLGAAPSHPRKTQHRSRERLPQVIRAEKELTKYPYSLLFSFLRLVKEPHEPKVIEDWVPAEQTLEWCSRYGLPATEELAIQVAAQRRRPDTQLALVAYYQPRLFQRYQRELEHFNAATTEEQRFPNDPTKADVTVRAQRILRNTQMQVLNFNPATEAQLYIAGTDCLRLDRFQRETAILYWLFQLWKALKDWEPFGESLGPIDPEQAENQRKAIHRYADLLLGLCQAPNRHVLASDVALASAIRGEREVRKALDRKLDPEVRTSYQAAQVHVDKWADTFATDVINQRLDEWVVLSWGPSGVVPRTRCVFGACYLQLQGLRQKPSGDWAQHLRQCAWPSSCGNLFWTEHGNAKYCEQHTKSAAHMAKKRARR